MVRKLLWTKKRARHGCNHKTAGDRTVFGRRFGSGTDRSSRCAYGVSRTRSWRRRLGYRFDCISYRSPDTLGVLCGLNSVYLPGDFKRVGLLAAQLPLAPENLAARPVAVSQHTPASAVEEIGALIRETFILVEQQMLEADTSRPRRWFDLPRTG